MSNSAYLVYLPQTQTLNEIVAWLQTKIKKAGTTQSGSTIIVAFGTWKVRVVDFQESWVGQEASELARRCQDKKKKALLQSSVRRLEIYPSDDPNDKHYNNGLLLFEHLSALPNAVGFDPSLGEFY